MTIPTGTALIVRFPGTPEGAPTVDGTVIGSDEGRVTVRVQNAGALPLGACVGLEYVDAGGDRRLSVGACVVEVDNAGRAAVLAVSGEPGPANKRGAYRVSTRCTDLRADMGGWRGCPVLDISAAGLSVEAPGVPQPGRVFVVTLRGCGAEVEGRFVVRHVAPSSGPGGVVSRCGLQAEPGQRDLAERMGEMAMTVQRTQLRNRARVAGPVVGPGVGPGVGARADAGAAEPGETTNPGDPSAGGIVAGDEGVEMQAGSAGAGSAGPGVVRLSVLAVMLVGRALPGSLRDRHGRIVAARGAVLDEACVAGLTRGELEVCEDWFEGKPGATGRERRGSERKSCRRGLRVWVVGPDGGRCVRAEMVDISRGGLGLAAEGIVHKGSVLVVEFAESDGAGWIVGRVENSAPVPAESGKPGGSRLGVRFLQTQVQRTPTPRASEMPGVVRPYRETATARAA